MMNKTMLLLILAFFSFKIFAQNVGVGTAAPTEKLDVNGNINVVGTIKANGTDGLPNQVLMKNGSGALAWGDLGYKNFATFLVSGNWTVPAGVTRIAVELWGAGGGGASVGGGGGGGYVMAQFNVTPGDILPYLVGIGGSGAGTGTGSGNMGTISRITVNGYNVDATGGQGATYNSAGSYYASGLGGGFSVTSGFYSYMVMSGQNGTVTRKNYTQGGTSLFYEMGEMGNGGDAGNTENTGAKGIYYTANPPGSAPAFADIRFSGGTASKVPGGGGGSYLVNSSAGANGMLVFHY